MARFRIKRTAPRLSGTKDKHKHDTLHLIETARVKVCKADKRLPQTLTFEEYTEVRSAVEDLIAQVEVIVDTAHAAAVRGGVFA